MSLALFIIAFTFQFPVILYFCLDSGIQPELWLHSQPPAFCNFSVMFFPFLFPSSLSTTKTISHCWAPNVCQALRLTCIIYFPQHPVRWMYFISVLKVKHWNSQSILLNISDGGRLIMFIIHRLSVFKKYWQKPVNKNVLSSWNRPYWFPTQQTPHPLQLKGCLENDPYC